MTVLMRHRFTLVFLCGLLLQNVVIGQEEAVSPASGSLLDSVVQPGVKETTSILTTLINNNHARAMKRIQLDHEAVEKGLDRSYNTLQGREERQFILIVKAMESQYYMALRRLIIAANEKLLKMVLTHESSVKKAAIEHDQMVLKLEHEHKKLMASLRIGTEERRRTWYELDREQHYMGLGKYDDSFPTYRQWLLGRGSLKWERAVAQAASAPPPPEMPEYDDVSSDDLEKMEVSIATEAPSSNLYNEIREKNSAAIHDETKTDVRSNQAEVNEAVLRSGGEVAEDPKPVSFDESETRQEIKEFHEKMKQVVAQ